MSATVEVNGNRACLQHYGCAPFETDITRLVYPEQKNPITNENYTKGQFTSYLGKALAVLRAGYEAGEAKLAVSAEGLGKSEICLQVK